MKPLASMAALLALTLASATALTQEAEPEDLVIAVACASDQGVPSDAAGRLCMALQLEAHRLPRRRAATVDYLLNLHPDFDPRRLLRDAQSDCQSAQALLERKRLRQAQRQAQSCLEALLPLEPWWESPQPTIDALITWALASHRGRHDRWQADLALVRLQNLFDPSLWQDQLPEELQERLQRIQTTQRQTAPGALRIQSHPSPAQVWLNGQPLGVTPLTLPSLPVGDHLLGLRLPGHQPQAQLVTVAPQDTTMARVVLPEAHLRRPWLDIQRRLPVELGQPLAGSGLRELAALLFLNQILGLRVLPGDAPDQLMLELMLYDMRSGQLLALVRDHVSAQSDLEQQRATFEALLPLLLQAVKERAALPPVAAPEPFYQTWWFWTGVGAVTLSAATVGALLLSGDDPAPTPKTGALEIRF